MGANTSVYTKDSIIPIVMRDYAWNDPPTKEQLELDIPIELSLWGALAIFMFVFKKIGAVGLYAGTDFKLSMLGNSDKNPNGIYLVDTTLYFINGISYIVDAAINLVVIVFGLMFYTNRV